MRILEREKKRYENDVKMELDEYFCWLFIHSRHTDNGMDTLCYKNQFFLFFIFFSHTHTLLLALFLNIDSMSTLIPYFIQSSICHMFFVVENKWLSMLSFERWIIALWSAKQINYKQKKNDNHAEHIYFIRIALLRRKFSPRIFMKKERKIFVNCLQILLQFKFQFIKVSFHYFSLSSFSQSFFNHGAMFVHWLHLKVIYFLYFVLNFL